MRATGKHGRSVRTVLETNRLLIRAFSPRDWKDLQEYVAQDEVMRYDHPWPSSDEELRRVAEHLAAREGVWAVCLKETGKLIGHVVCAQSEPQEFLNWDLGFGFNPRFHRQGYATEACERVLRFVFDERGARRVTSACHPDNAPAWKLLERLGLRREAHHRKPGFLRKTPEGEPVWSDSYEYAVLAEEWRPPAVDA